MIRRGFALLGLIAIFSITGLAQTEPETSIQVEIILRGPDAHLVADKTVEIKPVEQGKTPQPAQFVTTDSRGVARFKVRPGYFSLAITVHEIGYGLTAPTSFEPGETAHPVLPLLAGYGSMDGTTPSTCAPKALITLSSLVNANRSMLKGIQRTRADQSGHFHVADIPGGNWSIVASSNERGDGLCGDNSSVYVKVGENVTGVTLLPVWQAPPPSTPAQPQITSAPSSPAVAAQQAKTGTPGSPAETPAKTKTIGHAIKSDTPIVWAQGKVTDERGQPAANANVYALGTFQGNIRQYEAMSKATTDQGGHYELKGADGLSGFNATLIAIAPGHPPAWAWPAFPQISWHASNPPTPEPVTQDMVLPSESGRMSVTVLQDGQPVPSASVAVYLEGANLRDHWARGGGGEAREELENVVHPAATADANGIAHFENLLPGRYTIYALAKGKISDLREMTMFPGAERSKPGTTATGIPVRIGEETRHSLNVYEEKGEVSFTVLNRDGVPLQGNVPILLGPAGAAQSFSSVSLNSNGQGSWNMGLRGLSEIRFVHKQGVSTGGSNYPKDFQEPYDFATALFAISPNLPDSSMPAIRMRQAEPSGVDIVVLDSQGKPLRATVSITKGVYLNPEVGVGTTNERGEISFSGLEAGVTYTVIVSGTELTAIKTLGWDYTRNEILNAAEAHTRDTFFEKAFVAERESRTRIVMRPAPIGYAIGTGSSNKLSFNELGFWLDRQANGWESKIVMSPITGEFIAGPLPAGKSLLHFRIADHPAEFAVPVVIDPVKKQQDRLDIDLDRYAAETKEPSRITDAPNAFLDMGGISAQTTGAQHLVGQVFLSDGKTPVLGAQVLYFEPGSVSSPVLAITDALGKLHSRGLWRNGQTSSADNSLESPVAVAFLPGNRGATIYDGPIQRDKPLRLVLPLAISLSGAVTIGGKDLLHRPGLVHVVAEYQDKGLLNAALSIETTADAEGNFTLAGLTPGRYLIQAVLDDIWMSPTAMIHVGDEKLQPLHLAIPAPGAPVQITLIGRDGKPAIGHVVTLDRSGPLSNLWPAELRSDGAGLIYLPTMETGLHHLHVDGVIKPVKIDVPPLPAAPVTVRVQTEP